MAKEEIPDYWSIVKKRKGTIFKITLIILVIVLIVSLVMPKTYESESVVQLARVGGEIYSPTESISIIKSSSVLQSIVKSAYPKSSLKGFIKNNLDVKVASERSLPNNPEPIPYVYIKTKAEKPEKAKQLNEAVIEAFFAYVNINYNSKLNLLNQQLIDTSQAMQDIESQISSLQNSQLSDESTSKIILLRTLLYDYRQRKANLDEQLSNSREYKIISEAEVPRTFSSPKIFLNLFAALITGLLLSLFWIFLSESRTK